MKKRWFMAAGLVLSGAVAYAAGSLDLTIDSESKEYVDSSWLGGSLTINAVSADEVNSDLVQLRVKMTGAGSIAAGRSEYFVTTIAAGSELPAELTLQQTNRRWRVAPGGATYSLDVEKGSLDLISGSVAGRYGFDAVLSDK